MGVVTSTSAWQIGFWASNFAFQKTDSGWKNFPLRQKSLVNAICTWQTHHRRFLISCASQKCFLDSPQLMLLWESVFFRASMKASLNSSAEQCVHPQYGSYECTCVFVDHSKPTACVHATFFWCSKAFKHKNERPNILIFDIDVPKFPYRIRTLAKIFTHCVKKVRPSGG